MNADSDLSEVQKVGEDAVVGEIESCDFAGGVEASPVWRGLLNLPALQ